MKLTTMTIMGDDRQRRQLKQLSQAYGQSMSSLIRRALTEFIARERRKRLAERAILADLNRPTSPRRAEVAVNDQEN